MLDYLKKEQTLNGKCKRIFEYIHQVIWKNTNKLLIQDRKYVGIKTGNTPNAKYCLATQKEDSNGHFICSKIFAIPFSKIHIKELDIN